jgi:hypothetical protein
VGDHPRVDRPLLSLGPRRHRRGPSPTPALGVRRVLRRPRGGRHPSRAGCGTWWEHRRSIRARAA